MGDRMPNKVDVLPERYRKISKENMTDMAGHKLFKPRHPQTIDYVLEARSGNCTKPLLILCHVSYEKFARELQVRSWLRAHDHATSSRVECARDPPYARASPRSSRRRARGPEGYLRKRRAFRAALIPDLDGLEDLDESELWRLEEQVLEEWLPTLLPSSKWNAKHSGRS